MKKVVATTLLVMSIGATSFAGDLIVPQHRNKGTVSLSQMTFTEKIAYTWHSFFTLFGGGRGDR